jgi:hypothetical protein
MINRYFNRPIFFDYTFGVIAVGIVQFLYFKYKFEVPEYTTLLSLTTDLSTVALTFAGFVLTLLTVLVTFKMSAKVPLSIDDNENIPLFELFFSTKLYPLTVSLLKGCIISLGVISLSGFALKLFLPSKTLTTLFLFNIFGLTILAFTFARSLMILGLITGLQNNHNKRQFK